MFIYFPENRFDKWYSFYKVLYFSVMILTRLNKYFYNRIRGSHLYANIKWTLLIKYHHILCWFSHRMEGETERLFRSFFGPCVGVLCSADGANAIGRNGLTIAQLFQPFSTVNGDLTSRDMTGQLHSVSQARFKSFNRYRSGKWDIVERRC